LIYEPIHAEMNGMRRMLTPQLSAGSAGSWLLREPRRPLAVRESPAAHWYVLASVCIGAFMGQLDASIVTVALPGIGRDLGAGVGAVEWVALAYLLILVATVATVGRLADAVGRKLLYVYGFGVFTIGSLLCGLAPTLAVLIGARVLQAIGAAMLQANGVALVAEAMPRHLLPKALGIQGSAQAVGLALGPLIGGVLLSLAGWRLIFLVNLPAGVLGMALGWFLLPRSRSRRHLGGGDRAGAVLLALAAAGPLIYLSLGLRQGYTKPWLMACLTGGVLSAIAFVRRERRVAHPLIDLSILRRPGLAAGLSGGFVSFIALFGILFVVPYHLSASHVSPVWIGLQLAILPAAIGVAAPLAGRYVARVGTPLMTGGGLVLAAAGMLEIAAFSGPVGLLTGLALAGLGLGAFIPANNSAVMSASPEGHAGVTSGLLNMTRGLGTAVGVALAATLYATGPGLATGLGALGTLALATGLGLLARGRPAGAR
jgi:EmrB/QacA subfamily drug resistance transporter